MSKKLNWGFSDTPISGVSELNFPRAKLNFPKDFATKEDESGTLTLTNLTTPLDRAETVRFSLGEIKNVYNNTSIDPKVQSPNRKGLQLLVQIQDVASVFDDQDAAYRVDLPIQTHVVIKVPADALVTGDVVQQHLGRVVSALYDTGAVSTDRIGKLLRGALNPT